MMRPRSSRALVVLLLLLAFSTVSCSALPLFDSAGYPLFHLLIGGGDTATDAMPYTPANFGAAITSTNSMNGVLGVKATIMHAIDRNGCNAAAANLTGVYSGRVVVIHRDSTCTDHTRALNAQSGGALVVVMVGCPAWLFDGGAAHSGGHCSWSQPLNSTSNTSQLRVNIPVLLISELHGSALSSYMSSSDVVMFAPGSGAISSGDWSALRDLAASLTIGTDQRAAGTREFAELLPTIESTYVLPSSVAGGQSTTFTLTQLNLNYNLDPCISRVRGIWCVAGRVASLTLVGIGTQPVPSPNSPRAINTLPSSLADLTELRACIMPANVIQGAISRSIWNMPNLVHLDLSQQMIEGNMTADAATSSSSSASLSLQFVNLANNLLSGPLLDSWLVRVGPTLRSLNLANNRLTGPLPRALRIATHIEVMQLDYNSFAGGFEHDTFISLTQLRVLTTEHCTLSGTLPTAIGQLTNLTMISLGHNSFTGSIPLVWFTGLRRLESFSVSTNLLTGAIPPEIRYWTELTSLRLSSNRFAGAIPSELGSLTKLQSFDVASNGFTSLPSSMCQLSNLQEILADSNQLGGRIFEANENSTITGIPDLTPNTCWTQLKVLRLSHNRIEGAIPLVAGMNFLTELAADDNLFGQGLASSSAIATDVFNSMPALETLSFAGNALSFTLGLPDFIGCASLRAIDLSSNRIAATAIPTAWSLPRLQVLRLNQNQLTGTGGLQSMATQTPALQEINLSGNQLVMPTSMIDIGSYLAQLPTSIQRIYLSSNRLAGTFNTDLDRIGFGNLTQLVLAHNLITSVPQRILYDAIPALVMLDLSFNQIDSNTVLSNAQPISSLSTLKLDGNPRLTSSLVPPLPSWLISSGTYTKSRLDQKYTCPIFTGASRPMLVTIDPEVYAHTLCECERGTYGTPPNCQTIPTLISNEPTDSTTLAMTTLAFGGTISDTAFGAQRMSSGMDTLWVLGTNTTTATSPRIRAIFIDLALRTTDFNNPHDMLSVYAGGEDRSSSPVYEFYGSSYAKSALALNSSLVSSSSAVDPSIVHYRLLIPASKATLNFRSRSESGYHFSANWSVSTTCPDGYQLVQQEYLQQVDIRYSIDEEEKADGVCLPIYKPNTHIQLLIYIFTGLVVFVNLLTFCFLIRFRSAIIIRSSNIPLSIQLLFWNIVLSCSGLFFTIAPAPDLYSGGVFHYPGWECLMRPWPLTLGVVGILSALLIKSVTLMRIFSSTKLSVLQGLTPKRLFLTSCGLMSIQVLMLVLYTAMPLSKIELVRGTGEMDGLYIFQCSSLSGPDSTSYKAWLVVEFIMMGVFIIASLYVAWKNRNLPAAYNESRHTSHAMACMCFLALITIASNFIVESNPDQVLAIRGLGINLGALVLVLILFMPKVYHIMTGLGNEKIMTQLTQSKIDEAVVKQIAAHNSGSSGSDGGDSGSGSDSFVGVVGRGGPSSSTVVSPISRRSSRLGADMRSGPVASPHRLSQSFMAKQGVILSTPPKQRSEQEPSISARRPSHATQAHRRNLMADPPSVSMQSRVSISRSTVAPSQSPVKSASPPPHSHPRSPSKIIPPRPSSVVPGSMSDDNRPAGEGSASQPIEPTPMQHTPVFDEATVDAWRAQHEAEVNEFVSQELEQAMSAYAAALAAQTSYSAALQAQLVASHAALVNFDSWLCSMLSAVPSDSVFSRHKHLFDGLRPSSLLLRPIPPHAMAQVNIPPMRTFKTNIILAANANGNAQPPVRTNLTFNATPNMAARVHPTPLPLSPGAPNTHPTHSMPNDIILPESSWERAAAAAMAAVGGASCSPASTTSSECSPGAPSVSKAQVFHAALAKQESSPSSPGATSIPISHMPNAGIAMSNSPEGDSVMPLFVARISNQSHKRDLSRSIPDSVRSKLSGHFNAGTGAMNLSVDSPGRPFTPDVSHSAVNGSLALTPPGSGAKGHRRRKTLAQKENNGRGEVGVFLQGHEQDDATEHTADNTADEGENDDDRTASNNTPTSSSTPVAVDPLLAFMMTANPLIGLHPVSPSPAAIAARRASIDRANILKAKLNLQLDDQHEHDSQVSYARRPKRVPWESSVSGRMADDSDDESDLRHRDVSAISKSSAPTTAIHIGGYTSGGGRPTKSPTKHSRTDPSSVADSPTRGITVVLEAVEATNAGSVAFAAHSRPPPLAVTPPPAASNAQRHSLLFMALSPSHSAAVPKPAPHIPIHQQQRSLDSAASVWSNDTAGSVEVDGITTTHTRTHTNTDDTAGGRHSDVDSEFDGDVDGVRSNESSYLGSRHHSRLRMPTTDTDDDNPLDRIEDEDTEDDVIFTVNPLLAAARPVPSVLPVASVAPVSPVSPSANVSVASHPVSVTPVPPVSPPPTTNIATARRRLKIPTATTIATPTETNHRITPITITPTIIPITTPTIVPTMPATLLTTPLKVDSPTRLLATSVPAASSMSPPLSPPAPVITPVWSVAKPTARPISNNPPVLSTVLPIAPSNVHVQVEPKSPPRARLQIHPIRANKNAALPQ